MKLFICTHCGSRRKNHNSWRNHERCCSFNPNRNYKNGMVGKSGSNQFIKAKELGLPMPPGAALGKPGNFTGKRHTEKTKMILSEQRSLNNKGGRSKWFEINGIKVQGTWEKSIAEILTERNIPWLKPRTKNHSLKYEMSGKIKTYTPDFYLINENLYLEVKGYWWGNDKEKMRLVLDQNPHVDIRIIEKQEYDKIMGGELVW